MIGTIIGAGIGLASSLIAASRSKKAAQKSEDQLAQQSLDNKLEYEKLSNQDYTQTAAARSALTAASEAAKERIKQARGVAAVQGGGTQEVAAAQQAAADQTASIAANIASEGQSRQDAVESQYQSRKDALAGQYYNLYNQRASNAAAMGSAGLQAGLGIAGADMQSYLDTGKGVFESMFKHKKIS